MIDDSIAISNKSMLMRIRALFSKEFISYIGFGVKYNKYWAINIFYVLKYQDWIRKFIKIKDIKQVVFYSYWFSSSTIALSLIKNKNLNLKYCTRVHGSDLYEEIHGFNSFPARQDVIENINKIFSISENGKNHILQNYYINLSKIGVSRLGVRSHSFLSKSLSNNTLHVVSCSSMISLKRIHLIIETLEYLKSQNIKIIWTHIGDGYLRKNFEKRMLNIIDENIQYNFLGMLSNNLVYSFYKNNNIDLFINVSSSEGVPVSIMEAQSFGIPCIATDVGGNSEIVNFENGYLLSSTPSIEEISRIFLNYYNTKTDWDNKRIKSLNNWEENYNSDKNYKQFVKELNQL